MDKPTDSTPSVPVGTGHGEAALERRPRLSRPTPSVLFAQRQSGGHGEPRTTRVIPALAEAAHTPIPNAALETPHEAPTAGPPPAVLNGAHAPDFPPDLVFIIRSGGTVLHVNRPLGQRLEEEVVGSPFTDWVFPEQHAAVNAAIARVFTTAQADGVELHGIQGHDPESWFECRIAPNLRDGNVVSVTIIARDVTRYRNAERALRERSDALRRELEDRKYDLERLQAQLTAEQPARGEPESVRFRAALEHAGEAMFLLDPDRETIVDLNDTACRWLQRRCTDIRGKAVADLGLGFPLLPPATFDVQFTETRDSRRPLVLEGEHRRQDGSTFPVEVAVIGNRFENKEYLLAVARDVKDRRRAQEAIAEAEAQYRALVEQSFDAVYVTTRGGEIVDANPAAFAVFGYRRDEFIGLDARSVMPNADDIRRFQRQMAAERFVDRLEVTLRRRDGTSFPAVLSASRRRDAHDRLLGYQWVVREVAAADAGTAGAESGADPAGAPAEPALPAKKPSPESSSPPAGAVVAPATAGGERPRREAASGGKVVLLVGGRISAQRDGAQALERAGFAVLQAADGTAALQAIRTHARAVDLAVVAGEGDEPAEAIARDLVALASALRIVLVRPDRESGAPADLGDVPILREPVHPLALVQAVREAFAARA